ncbi:adenylyl-sulfate kinase [Bacillus sp. RAR_GA_16]|uniref:adenylyl-sulfate kinase n=1 Tax=Bacillus sp. RAR_GA_16 TaxID=2876774 RepID=UPI001CCDF41C|nr:adenylyl-sulfate kinase [Bacillus sp. RAR_GA_16]MCA0171039.1 adenylyl-sulfate kinase [Bacillus sp. RAR_GA_16]
MTDNNHLTWHNTVVTKEMRQKRNQHKSAVLFFTGLSGSGKSTLANDVSRKLHELNVQSYVLDGDNIRQGLNKDLGFKEEDRKENIRRIGEVSKLLVDSGQFAITAFISPFQSDRQVVRELLSKDEFIEVYVKCPLNECELRDPKGLYKKARNGEIPHFTGVSSPYEEPINPELIVDTYSETREKCAEIVLSYLENHQLITPKVFNQA